MRRHKRHSKQRLAMLAMMPDRCRAHARSTGKPCVAKAMANGRCKNHGGMCTGAKTPEGRARISAAQTRRWEAWREKTARTKPAAAPVPIIPEPPTDILQRLMQALIPAKAESATEKWLREELESSNTPSMPEQKPAAPPERPVPAAVAERQLEFLSIKSELRRYQTSPYISKPPLPNSSDGQSSGSPPNARSGLMRYFDARDVRVRRPVSQVAKDRRKALCASLNEHQAKQIQARADLVALGIAPERAPWRRIRREAQEEMAEEQRFARRQAAALESARLAREPKPTDDTDE